MRLDAQPAPVSPAAARGTVLVTLGTAGGPRPRKNRSQSANLLLVDGEPYLVDAGENVVRRLTDAGVDFLRVGRIFITHGHSDHTLGLPALLATQWEFQRREPVNIYGPPGTKELVAGALAFLSVNGAIRFAEGNPTPLAAMVSATDAPPGVVYRDPRVTVTAVENAHFNFPRGTPAYGRYKSYSYRFATRDKVVVFTGDTGPSGALTALAKGADLLVSEVTSADELLALYKRNGTWQRKTPKEQKDWLAHQYDEHLSPAQVGALAAEAGVKSVVLTHLTPSADPDDAYARHVTAVRKRFRGDVRVAGDLDRF